VAVPRTFKWVDLPKGSLPVVLIDNGRMTAAAITCSEQDFADATSVRDTRPKQIYVVAIANIVAFGNDKEFNRLVDEKQIAA
jgi:hypothetical protein